MCFSYVYLLLLFKFGQLLTILNHFKQEMCLQIHCVAERAFMSTESRWSFNTVYQRLSINFGEQLKNGQLSRYYRLDIRLKVEILKIDPSNLWLGLGLDLVPLSRNVESGPRFAEIWLSILWLTNLFHLFQIAMCAPVMVELEGETDPLQVKTG